MYPIAGGRLTAAWDNPVNWASRGFYIYYVPYRGHHIGLWDSVNGWRVYDFCTDPLHPIFADIYSISQPHTNYDIFIKLVSGAPTLVSRVWANDRQRANAISLIDGIMVLTSNKAERYLGSIRTDFEGRVLTSPTQGFIYNYYNQVILPLYSDLSGFTTSYTSSTPRILNNSYAHSSIQVLCGVGGEMDAGGQTERSFLRGTVGAYGRGDGGDYHIGLHITTDLTAPIPVPQGNVSLARSAYQSVARADAPQIPLYLGTNHLQIVEYTYGGTGHCSGAGHNLSVNM